MNEESKNTNADLWRLIKSSNPSLGTLVLAIVLALVGVVGALWYPLLTSTLIDIAGTNTSYGNVLWLLTGAVVGMSAASAVSNYLLAKVGEQVVQSLRNRLTVKLTHQPVNFFDDQASGELASRVVNDSTVISTLITKEASGLISGVLLLVGSAIVLFLLDLKLTLVLLGVIAIAFLILLPVIMKLQVIAKDTQDKTATLTGILTQVFGETRLVKAFLAERREVKRGNEQISLLYKLGLRAARVNAVLEPIMGLASTISIMAILVYGGQRVAAGDLSVGTLTAFILYIFNVVIPLGQLSSFVAAFQSAKGASTRIVKILDAEDERLDEGDAPVPKEKSIRFEEVSFSYGDGPLILNGISFTLEAGKTTALVGASGSGKSTILSLIERFYAPSKGTIFCGDTPIEQNKLREWRGQIGYVPQSAPVMPGSIRDNICYALSREIDDEELKYAARKAHCLEFIEALEEGFETDLTEQGTNISGGQRQRLAIARMFLRDPSILILDEATSSLDSETEHHIKIALATLMKGRTNIVVAHRLSTIKDADKIIVLEDGAVSGEGAHALLVDNNPLYARLVKRQYGV